MSDQERIAWRDQRIAALEAQLSLLMAERDAAVMAADKRGQRIAELERHLPSVEDIQSIYAGASKDQLITELETTCQFLNEQRKARAALLDKIPHAQTMEQGEYRCIPSCPACAWEKLKTTA